MRPLGSSPRGREDWRGPTTLLRSRPDEERYCHELPRRLLWTFDASKLSLFLGLLSVVAGSNGSEIRPGVVEVSGTSDRGLPLAFRHLCFSRPPSNSVAN